MSCRARASLVALHIKEGPFPGFQIVVTCHNLPLISGHQLFSAFCLVSLISIFKFSFAYSERPNLAILNSCSLFYQLRFSSILLSKWSAQSLGKSSLSLNWLAENLTSSLSYRQACMHGRLILSWSNTQPASWHIVIQKLFELVATSFLEIEVVTFRSMHKCTGQRAHSLLNIRFLFQNLSNSRNLQRIHCLSTSRSWNILSTTEFVFSSS